MAVAELTSTAQVIEALGGIREVAKLTRRKYSAAHNWKHFDSFPANTFFVMQEALRERGLAAPASLWGMVEQPNGEAA